MQRHLDPYATAMSAVGNVTRLPVTRADVEHVLRTGEGALAHVIALFSELTLDTCLRIAILSGISDPELARAYRLARARYPLIANEELDAFVSEVPTDAG